MGESLSKWQDAQPPPGICRSTHLSTRLLNTRHLSPKSSRHVRKLLHTNRITLSSNVPTVEKRPSSAPPLLTTSIEYCDEDDDSFDGAISPAHSGFSSQQLSSAHCRGNFSPEIFYNRPTHPPPRHWPSVHRRKRTHPTKYQHPGSSGHVRRHESHHRYNYSSNMLPSLSKNSHYSSQPLDLSLPKVQQQLHDVDGNLESSENLVFVVGNEADIIAEHATIWPSGTSSGRTFHEHHHEIPSPPHIFNSQPTTWRSARPRPPGPHMTIHHGVNTPLAGVQFADNVPVNCQLRETATRNSNPLNYTSLHDQHLVPTATVPPFQCTPSFPIPVIDDDDDDDDEDIYVSYPSLRDGPVKKRRTNKRKKGKLWEFLLDLLLSKELNPKIIKWEDERLRIFKILDPTVVAELWGQRKSNPSMTFEKLSRAMRHYYKLNIMVKVEGRPHLYQFGDLSDA